jgi:glycosyltransferase involved in cell wall biosynthesis
VDGKSESSKHGLQNSMTGNKRILLVSNGFYPEISPRSYRATELAKEFVRQGHDVTVISKFRNHDYGEFVKEHKMTIRMWGEPRFPVVPNFKRKQLSLISRVLTRTLLILFEYPGIEEMFKVKRILGSESNYDLLISFAVPYPVHWGVAWARSHRKKIATVWIADCGDPYMGDILDSFRKPFYFGYLEKWFCRKSDYISIPIESAKPGYYSEFHNKIKVIPQGFDFNPAEREYCQPVNDIPTFAYAGGFLPGARDPIPLMKFLRQIDLPFRFLVFTNRPDLLNGYEEKLKGKLFLSGYIPRSELMKVLKKMDFLINFDNNTTLNSPSKLIDYAIADRPVLNISQNFKEEELMAFLARDYKSRMILPDPEQFHIKNISRLFLDLINR